ncbi:MAG TPA: hypothetical protein VG944_03155 [Fimbriimonas sp.]|nr:hypothetical protein [Fimbriimonas sp.]
MPVPWRLGAELSDTEKRAITKSVQSFQLGESSEGNHLRRAAKQWSEANSDLAYCESVDLFIKEEQRHARELGRFLELNSIDLIEKNWTDSLFRSIRRLAGLELSIMVLLTAEIVAQVYYVALAASTKSGILAAICNQIVKDEEQHVRFQCERLAIMARGRGLTHVMFRYGFQRAFLFCALPVVWSGNRQAYRAGGYSYSRFFSETWLAFNRAVPLMHPENYSWPS